jgi:S-adenosylmethionine-diacylgycerolhomoserine-N-methlytransferase
VIYFSYVLSMIPDWQPAVERAWELLAPGGTLGIVDFADQANVAPWRRVILLNWLKLFSVHPRPEIQRGLMCRQGVARIEDVMDGYAYIILLKKPI